MTDTVWYLYDLVAAEGFFKMDTHETRHCRQNQSLSTSTGRLRDPLSGKASNRRGLGLENRVLDFVAHPTGEQLIVRCCAFTTMIRPGDILSTKYEHGHLYWYLTMPPRSKLARGYAGV